MTTPYIPPSLGGTLQASGFLEGAGATASFLQPWMLPIAGAGIRGIYNLISNDRQEQIFNEVLTSQVDFRNQLARRAFGNLTPKDREDITAGGEAQVNQVANTVSSRGLGSSPEGANVVAEAQQQVFTDARQEALAALPTHDAAIATQMRSLFQTDKSFNEDLSQIMKLIAYELQQQNDPETDTSKDPNNDLELSDLLRIIHRIFGSPKPKQQGT